VQEFVTLLKSPKRLEYRRDFLYETLGCIQSSCLNAECRKQLVDVGVIDALITFSNPKDVPLAYGIPVIMVKYLSFISLCHIAMDEAHAQLIQNANGLQHLPEFFEKHTPEDVRAIERARGFKAWQYMKCFQSMYEFENTLIHRFGTFCLANLSYSDMNRAVIKEHKLLDSIFCLQWSRDELTRKYARTVITNFSLHKVPNLYDICKFAIQQHNIANPQNKLVVA